MLIFVPLLFLTTAWSTEELKSTSAYEANISPSTVATVPFGDSGLGVWEHLNHKGRYYVSPLAHFKNNSATVQWNFMQQVFKMVFDVIMWSENAALEVYDFLKRNKNTSHVQKDLIGMVPTEAVKIIWRDAAHRDEFHLDSSWRPNMPRQVIQKFHFVCQDRESCDELAYNMNINPEQFEHSMMLKYAMSARAAAKRRITVRATHITSGRLFSKLRSSVGTGNVYLSSDDANRMAQEASSNVFAEVVEDAEYEGNAGLTVKDMILGILKKHKTSSEKFKPKMWDSVFWQKDWARPDKLASELNKNFKLAEGDKRTLVEKEAKSRNAQSLSQSSASTNASDASGSKTRSGGQGSSFDNSKSSDTSVSASGSGMGVSMSASAQHKQSSRNSGSQASNYDNSDAFTNAMVESGSDSKAESASGGKSRRIKVDEAKRFLDKKKAHLTWTGEKFVVKPMDLYRVSESMLTQRDEIGTISIKVKKYQAIHEVPVRFFMEERATPITVELLRTRQALSAERKRNKATVDSINRVHEAMINRINKTHEAIVNRINQSHKAIENRIKYSHDAIVNRINGTTTQHSAILSGMNDTIADLLQNRARLLNEVAAAQQSAKKANTKVDTKCRQKILKGLIECTGLRGWRRSEKLQRFRACIKRWSRRDKDKGGDDTIS